MARKVGEHKQRLADEIGASVTSILNYGEGSISVSFEDVHRRTAKVYRTDIAGSEHKLYKKPGYRM